MFDIKLQLWHNNPRVNTVDKQKMLTDSLVNIYSCSSWAHIYFPQSTCHEGLAVMCIKSPACSKDVPPLEFVHAFFLCGLFICCGSDPLDGGLVSIHCISETAAVQPEYLLRMLWPTARLFNFWWLFSFHIHNSAWNIIYPLTQTNEAYQPTSNYSQETDLRLKINTFSQALISAFYLKAVL